MLSFSSKNERDFWFFLDNLFAKFLLSFLLRIQKKRNKEKGALSKEFFSFPIEKTVLETPRRSVTPLLLSELSSTILWIRKSVIYHTNLLHVLHSICHSGARTEHLDLARHRLCRKAQGDSST